MDNGAAKDKDQGKYKDNDFPTTWVCQDNDKGNGDDKINDKDEDKDNEKDMNKTSL